MRTAQTFVKKKIYIYTVYIMHDTQKSTTFSKNKENQILKNTNSIGNPQNTTKNPGQKPLRI